MAHSTDKLFLGAMLMLVSVFSLFAGCCTTLPTSQTVEAYDLAFFACELPERGQPLWVINTTEYLSSNLIPDHVTNLSGLIVHARPEYNNTGYQCRFVDVSVNEFGFIDKETETSPKAVLTILGQYIHKYIM